MRKIVATLLIASFSSPAFASPASDAETALARYCEPLLQGTSASQASEMARADGFSDVSTGSHPALMKGELIVMVSDNPRVCAVQASAAVTFSEGVMLVDRWASRHPGAVQSPAQRGPDGARVRAWTAPKANRYLLVTEQTNPRGQKVLSFILAPGPSSR